MNDRKKLPDGLPTDNGWWMGVLKRSDGHASAYRVVVFHVEEGMCEFENETLEVEDLNERYTYRQLTERDLLDDEWQDGPPPEDGKRYLCEIKNVVFQLTRHKEKLWWTNDRSYGSTEPTEYILSEIGQHFGPIPDPPKKQEWPERPVSRKVRNKDGRVDWAVEMTKGTWNIRGWYFAGDVDMNSHGWQFVEGE